MLRAFSGLKPAAQGDKHCGLRPAKLRAKSSGLLREQWARRDPSLNQPQAFSFPPNLCQTHPCFSSTLGNPAELLSPANTPRGIAGKRAWDSAKTPKYPTVRCACAREVARPYAVRLAASRLVSFPACPQEPCASRHAPHRRPATWQAARAAPSPPSKLQFSSFWTEMLA